MLFFTRPRKVRFAWLPIEVDRPETGGRIFLWLEKYERHICPSALGSTAAWIATRRIRTGETFEFTRPGYYES